MKIENLRFEPSTKLAMYGGTFDPIHKGHLYVLEMVHKYTDFNHIFCVPTSRNPLKTHAPIATDSQRLDMLTLAIADIDYVSLLDYEIKKGKVCFTIDTINILKKKFGIVERIGLIIGSDEPYSIEKWKDLRQLNECTHYVIVPRPNFTDYEFLHQKMTDLGMDYTILYDIETIDIASSAIRKNLREHSIGQASTQVKDYTSQKFLPRKVFDYITQQKVY